MFGQFNWEYEPAVQYAAAPDAVNHEPAQVTYAAPVVSYGPTPVAGGAPVQTIEAPSQFAA